MLDTIQSAYRWDAAIAAVPVIDTVKHVDAREQWITHTPDRRSLWAAQTPQAFAFPIVREAYQRAREEGFCGTDDASLVERIGVKVRLAQGHYDNIKITNPADLIVGESLLAARGGSER